MLGSADAHAGQDRARIRYDENADIPIQLDFKISYAYPPTNEDVEEMEHIIQGAHRILCDVTDGQFGLGTVWLTAGSGGMGAADVFLLPEGLWTRATSNGFILQ